MATGKKGMFQKKSVWSFVRLTMTGKDLDPQKVSKAVGIAPDIGKKRGDRVGPNSERICKQGSWQLESSQLNWRLETQMRNVLRRISSVQDQLRRVIKEDTTIERAYLTIALELPSGCLSTGYYLPSEIIGRFTSLGLDINLSIYAPVG